MKLYNDAGCLCQGGTEEVLGRILGLLHSRVILQTFSTVANIGSSLWAIAAEEAVV